MNRTALFLLKLFLSLGLLIYLLRSVDLEDVLLHLHGADVRLLVVAVTIYAIVVLLSTVRWKVLLEAVGGEASYVGLLRSYMVATFFNNFLPSNVGGDVVRVRDGARIAGSKTASLTVAVIDRVIGFVALYAIASVAFLMGGPLARGLAGARVILAGLTLLFLAIGGIFLRSGLITRLVDTIGLRRWPWVYERFESTQDAINSFRAQKGSVGFAFALSIVLQLLGIAYFFLVARALNIPLNFLDSLLMVPLCTLIQAIPISFNGWGLRESVYVVYFRQVGLPKESALAFSIVASALVVVLSISGLFVWLSKRQEKIPQSE